VISTSSFLLLQASLGAPYPRTAAPHDPSPCMLAPMSRVRKGLSLVVIRVGPVGNVGNEEPGGRSVLQAAVGIATVGSDFQGRCGRPVGRRPSPRGRLSKRSGRSSTAAVRRGIFHRPRAGVFPQVRQDRAVSHPSETVQGVVWIAGRASHPVGQPESISPRRGGPSRQRYPASAQPGETGPAGRAALGERAMVSPSPKSGRSWRVAQPVGPADWAIGSAIPAGASPGTGSVGLRRTCRPLPRPPARRPAGRVGGARPPARPASEGPPAHTRSRQDPEALPQDAVPGRFSQDSPNKGGTPFV
jgi:hypothetical protein